jgi:hypothetical protein
MRRKRPPVATVIALVALVVALGGTAVAASRYIITSTHQIKPSVLRVLHGRRGIAGPQGRPGVPGVAGQAGKQGLPGGSGPAGPQGENGANGVTARVRGIGSVTSLTEPASASDSLSGGQWTQQTQELEHLIGRVSVTSPAKSSCSGGTGESEFGGSLIVSLALDGTTVGRADAIAGITQEDQEIGFQSAGQGDLLWLFEPSSPTNHTVTLSISDNCGFLGGHTGGHFTINSVSIDVVGVK